MDRSELKQLRQKNRWMRRLKGRVIARVLKTNPEQVTFRYFPETKPEIVECLIRTQTGMGVGVSICSVLDKFCPIRGRNIAAMRAANAILRKDSSGYVRNSVEQFPQSWTLKQVGRVQKYASHILKSKYMPVGCGERQWNL